MGLAYQNQRPATISGTGQRGDGAGLAVWSAALILRNSEKKLCFLRKKG